MTFPGKVRDQAPGFQRQGCRCPRPRPRHTRVSGLRGRPRSPGGAAATPDPAAPILPPPPAHGSHRPAPLWRPAAVTSGPARSTSRRCAGAWRHAWLAREERCSGTRLLLARGALRRRLPAEGGEEKAGGCVRPPASPRAARRWAPLGAAGPWRSAPRCRSSPPPAWREESGARACSIKTA